ncbi:bifunctional deaminase-reductase domain protein [Pseudonocardia dioxanivorans CB1190]|uniref:Bifunctional deaminase-reductase domain protein n=1 Tax=Pseudonocardia dioxanivorans (strain ATCC 55486 / DSM 44775 / JCM 13855 / CB1190) TaxID=675635 RepID=F4D1U2_PSEUX|nr:dihydrofolate reductase family protein [Pseudonocardia dioxanivorans]AEA28002.1 bifunctional deaminase-reductase domain protein [Pseudonocardia dioxanivorans CB1190]
MKLTVMQFVSLDGVCQGPGAPDEDTTDGFGRGGWLVPFVDERFLEIVTEWTCRAGAFLFGRRTYEAFSRDWPTSTDPDDPVATRLNGLPKYVASTTLREAGWAPSTILAGDVEGRVAELRARPGPELQVHGSARLAASLLAAGLVDELRLAVAPVVVGAGRRFFRDDDAAAAYRAVDHETTPSGVALLTYEPAGAAAYGRIDVI